MRKNTNNKESFFSDVQVAPQTEEPMKRQFVCLLFFFQHSRFFMRSWKKQSQLTGSNENMTYMYLYRTYETYISSKVRITSYLPV